MSMQRVDIKTIKRPCKVCMKIKNGDKFKVRDDSGVIQTVTFIAYCPYCGGFLLEKENAQLREQSRWIPVSEGYPKEYVLVLVWNGSCIFRAEYVQGQWYGVPNNEGFLPADEGACPQFHPKKWFLC